MNLFPASVIPTSVTNLINPETYTGLAGFHKYWGKKPTESMSYLIENCTDIGDIVMDPFLGSGLIALECLQRNRRFIGIDINPFSIEHTSFLLDLPTSREYYQALIEIEQSVVDKINSTYLTADNRIASHYLWEKGEIVSVWIKAENGSRRIEIDPSNRDLNSFLAYQNYTPIHFKNPKFFTNSRINVKPSMSIRDLFTGRAIHNIELLIEAISKYPGNLKRALLLTLTSSTGQMSNMVFAIKNRGKGKKGGIDNKIEVGSWIIGYWLPETHFEINVWNCFKSKANKLLKILPQQKKRLYTISDKPTSLGDSFFNAWLINSDCRLTLAKIPTESISFICTDPPHSDRIPYLELSEMWNSFLGYDVDFEREIVVSNAKERHKSKSMYNKEMTEFLMEASRVLKKRGYIALYFNARDEESWLYLKCIEGSSDALKFVGCFPLLYSATSVIQDNRKGSMKNDYVILYQKNYDGRECQLPEAFFNIPGWSSRFPEKNQEFNE